jgi:methionyl-tRNA formyltransferase
LKVIFAGTPEFARIALERLHAAGHTIALVLTQPDRPAGRGMKLQASAVKQFALDRALPLAQPRSLRLDGKYPEDALAACSAIEQARADVMVVAAYGLILPQWVLDNMAPTHCDPHLQLHSHSTMPKLGCLNIHGSLLPRWRGAAPIHRAIEAGDTHTGVTIMQMDTGLDTGDMLLVQSVPIGVRDTTAQLHDQLAQLGADMIVNALALGAAGRLQPQPQPQEGVSYAHKVEKHEAAINWHLPAVDIVRKVHAFNPFPIANATLDGEVIKVWAAHALSKQEFLIAAATPSFANAALPTALDASQNFGEIVAVKPAGIAVKAMNSVVMLTELQRPGGKRLDVASLQRGFDVRVGMRFDLTQLDLNRPAA